MKYLKKNLLSVLILFIIILGLSACNRNKLRITKHMVINHIDLSNVKDGRYEGDFLYGSYRYIVEVIVKEHEFKEINILQNRKKKYAKKAEEVIPRIMEEQRNDVEAVAGATTTSKALLKAIENALRSEPK